MQRTKYKKDIPKKNIPKKIKLRRSSLLIIRKNVY